MVGQLDFGPGLAQRESIVNLISGSITNIRFLISIWVFTNTTYAWFLTNNIWFLTDHSVSH